jgi:hypothetical protein
MTPRGFPFGRSHGNLKLPFLCSTWNIEAPPRDPARKIQTGRAYAGLGWISLGRSDAKFSPMFHVEHRASPRKPPATPNRACTRPQPLSYVPRGTSWNRNLPRDSLVFHVEQSRAPKELCTAQRCTRPGGTGRSGRRLSIVPRGTHGLHAAEECSPEPCSLFCNRLNCLALLSESRRASGPTPALARARCTSITQSVRRPGLARLAGASAVENAALVEEHPTPTPEPP